MDKPLILIITIVFGLQAQISEGSIFDFAIVANLSTAAEQLAVCTGFGYDGFAIVNSPESYAYAVKISAALRAEHDRGAYIGLHYSTDTGDVINDDDTIPPSDLPWANGVPDTDPTIPIGVLRKSDSLVMVESGSKRLGICGNHKTVQTEAHGTIASGRQPSGVSSSLASTIVSSFLECALLCGQDYRCRAASFNRGDLTCLTLGPDSYTGLVANSAINTFIRVAF